MITELQELCDVNMMRAYTVLLKGVYPRVLVCFLVNKDTVASFCLKMVLTFT